MIKRRSLAVPRMTDAVMPLLPSVANQPAGSIADSINEVMAFTMPNGTTRNVSVYEGIPVFQNDYLSVVETANGAALTGGALTSVYAGCFDDGSNKIGVSMIHPEGVPVGVAVEDIGAAEAKDERIIRVKSYSNFASFNRKGVARLPSINN